MVSDLSIGNTFTLQLIPDLANDLFLHGTITSFETANVPAGTFPGCVRVDYLVDYGAITCIDASGGAGGTNRAETRGYVLYAPFVGPVQSYEEYIITETTGACGPGDGVWARTSMRLNTPAVPVLNRSWGRLKALYR